MAKKQSAPNGRRKAYAARKLNTLFTEPVPARDGRSERRRQRLLRELREGRGGEPLQPIRALEHISTLLALGETLATLRRLPPRLPARPALDAALLAAIRDAQRSFGFDPRAWQLLGFPAETIEDR